MEGYLNAMMVGHLVHFGASFSDNFIAIRRIYYITDSDGLYVLELHN